MPNPFALFFALLIGHAIADYPLQGDFLAKAKNPANPIDGIPWWIAMSMHCLIHAGAVWFITGNIFLGLAELGLHFLIDWLKCEYFIEFGLDQFLHISCKVMWAVLFFVLY